jgi:hypothetical protein
MTYFTNEETEALALWFLNLPRTQSVVEPELQTGKQDCPTSRSWDQRLGLGWVQVGGRHHGAPWWVLVSGTCWKEALSTWKEIKAAGSAEASCRDQHLWGDRDALHSASVLPWLSTEFRGALESLDWLPLPGNSRLQWSQATGHPSFLSLGSGGPSPWPGWAQGAKRGWGLGTEGIDNKKTAVPWGNFKVPGAEIYV